jgi:putative transposase
MADRLRTKRHDQAGRSWYVDETYLKVQGKWCYKGVAVFHSALTQEKCNTNAASKKAFAGVSALVHFSLTPLIELVCTHRSI